MDHIGLVSVEGWLDMDRIRQAIDAYILRPDYDDELYDGDDEDYRMMEEGITENQNALSSHDIDRLMDIFEEI